MTGRRHWTVGLLCSVVVLVLVLPTLVVIPVSFSASASFGFPPEELSTRWYANFFDDARWMAALRESLWIAVLTTIVATVVGTAAALGLDRLASRWGVAATRGLLILPVVIPGIVLAVGVYAVFARLGLIGTTAGFVLAHAVVALPFVVVTVGVNLSSLDPRLEQAAAGLGASGWGSFRQVTLPLLAPGIAAGALFAFVTSFDEVVISLFIKSPFKETLPVRMYASMTESIDPTIAAAATLVLALTTVLLVVFGLATRAGARRLDTAQEDA